MSPHDDTVSRRWCNRGNGSTPAGKLGPCSAIACPRRSWYVVRPTVTPFLEGASRCAAYGGRQAIGPGCPQPVARTALIGRPRVEDNPGVLADISKALGDNDVSIRIVKQTDVAEADAELVVMTHEVKECKMQRALDTIKSLPAVNEICSLIRTGL